MDRYEFGAEIRRRRLARGLTQNELAQKCGVTQSRVATWEAAKHRPDGTSTFKLARVLGKSLVEKRFHW